MEPLDDVIEQAVERTLDAQGYVEIVHGTAAVRLTEMSMPVLPEISPDVARHVRVRRTAPHRRVAQIPAMISRVSSTATRQMVSICSSGFS